MAWAYFILCFLMLPTSEILRGGLPDPDDYLHLVQALDLLNGQGWFDPIQHRMNPPDGTYIHFSNLLSVVYAVPIYFLSFLLDKISAATVTAAIMPTVFLACFFLVLSRASAFFVGQEWARISSFVALFATTLMFQFNPGHVDHHGVEAVLCLLAVTCCLQSMDTPSNWRWPVMTGGVLALALVIGLEVLPFLVLVVAWMGLWAAIKGGKATIAGAICGLTLAVTGFLLLVMTKSWDHVFDRDVLAYSIVYVFLLSGAAFCLLGIACAANTSKVILRVGIAAVLAGVSGYCFFHFFPELKAGPYGGMNQALANLMFDNIVEARPIIRDDRSWVECAVQLVWPLTASLTAIVYFVKRRKDQFWRWGLLSFLIVSTTLLAALYQVRFLVESETFCILAMTPLLKDGLAYFKKKYTDGALCTARVGIFLVVAPFPCLILPAMFDGRSFNPGLVLFLNRSIERDSCDIQEVSRMLAMPSYYGNRSRVIMNMMNSGPELMFRTPHMVLAAPFHMNVSGNIDSVDFFSAEDETVAHELALRRKVELVVMCRSTFKMYTRPQAGSDNIQFSEGGKVIRGDDEGFARQLVNGKIPNWLKPIEFPTFGNMMLFEVKDAMDSSSKAK